MGLMARVAGDSARMIGSHDLWKRLRLGAVGLVTTGTHHSRIKLGGSNRCRILGVVGECSMASLTRNHDVLTQLFLVYDLSVAPLADLVSRKSNRTSRGLGDGISAIVAVLSEAVWDHSAANKDKSDHRNGYDHPQHNERFDV